MSRQFSQDFLIEVAKGNVAGHSLVHKFGSVNNVGSAITPVSTSNTYETPTTVTALEILSSSANDTSAGSGARKIDVTGIDSGWNVLTETVIMNGVTPVVLSNSFFRVFRMKVTESGTYASSTGSSHAGTITLRVSGGGTSWASMEVVGGFGLGQSQIGAYTIPTGKKGYVLSKTITKESAKNPNIYFFVRVAADDITTPYTGSMQVKELDRNIDSDIHITPRSPFGPFQGPADVGFMANVDTGTADISVDFEILLVDD